MEITNLKIYKVHHLINETKTKTIFVFYGYTFDNLDISKKFNDFLSSSHSDKDFIDTFSNSIIFSVEELRQIKENNINVIFSKQQIHEDDTIGTIKLKILTEFKNSFSLEEIYLFGIKQEKVNSVNVFEILTQDKKLRINDVRLRQFLNNIVDKNGHKIDFSKLPDKEYYDYSDILSLNLDNKVNYINKSLGQKYFIVENEYPYTINPFDANEFDTFIERASRKSLTTLNNSLLLSSGNILNNNIYLCFAEDVLKEQQNNELVEYIIKIYYPKLYSKDINTLDDILSSRNKLIAENSEFLSKNTLELFESVDVFYDVYKYKKHDLNYKSNGIKKVSFILYPDYKIKIPLDVIFKLIHATETNPLIKYNPSHRQEKIYRLYANKVSQDGRKIPYLDRAEIFKLMKIMGKNKSVSIYIVDNDEKIGANHTINCEFEEDGKISVKCEFGKSLSVNDINKIIIDNVNPIIDNIKNYLEENGYTMSAFTSLDDENIEITEMMYEMEIEFDKINKFTTKNLMGCISSVFVVEDIDNFSENGVSLRYKRVSNFNKRSSQEAFIIEKMIAGYRAQDIVELLIENYKDMTNSEAVELISKIITEMEFDKKSRKRERIKINPGFKVTIKGKKFKNILVVTVDNINDINYLNTIPIYVDTLLRLTQEKGTTDFPEKRIKSICSGNEKKDIVMDESVSLSEKSIENQEEMPEIEDDEIKYTNIEEYEDEEEGAEKARRAISMFFGDDDEEEEDEQYGGRNSDESSEKSLESFSSDYGYSVKSSEPSDASSSEKSISSFQQDEETSEKSLSSINPITKTSEKSLSSFKQDTQSDKSLSSFKQDTQSEKSLSSFKQDTPSEKSLSSFKQDDDKSLSSFKQDEEDKSLSSFKQDDEDKSLSSFKQDEEEKSLSSFKQDTPSEKSLSSFKQDEDKSLSSFKQDDEKSLSSFKQDTPSEKSLSSFKQDEEPSKKSPTPVEKSPTPVVKPLTPVEEIVKTQMEKKTQKPVKETKKLKGKKTVILESDEEEKIVPVYKPKETGERNIDGMPLSNQNSYFQNRIEERDPVLIIKTDQGKFKRYSRVCQSAAKRQPVILDKSELDRINREHPGFLKEEDVINYGSTPDKDFYYICPKYWDLKRETIITEEEIKKNKLEDKIIPDGETQVPKGKYIYKFKDEKQYPNFVKGDKHPNGYCLPCCVTKFNTEAVIKTREKCTGQMKKPTKQENKEGEKKMEEDEDTEEDQEKEIKEEQKKEEPEEKKERPKGYVLGPEKYPLEKDRWGYLPIAIQKLFQTSNAECQISKTNTNLKPNHACLLRHGVENNQNQSFIACIADAVFYTRVDSNGSPYKISIEKMKNIIIQTLTIDNFIKYQNGNLVTDFKDPERFIDENKMTKYKSSNIYKKIEKNNSPENQQYFMSLCSSFENFVSYLKDPNIKIDYTYLWDIVCDKNEYIFSKGINLVIFEMPENDVTNNVEIVCPTNHYTMKSFDPRKSTLFLLKQGDFFEPLYSYKFDIQKNTLFVTKIFSEYDTHSTFSSSMKNIFNKIVKPFYDDLENNVISCRPKNSISKNVYKAEHAQILDKIIQILNEKKYTIIKQVLNYQSKVIGVIVKDSSNSNGNSGFVPCYPSSINENYDYDYMIEDGLWNNYTDTLNFLKSINKNTGKRIKTMPLFKVVEDEMIVGIITETNQFVQLSKPQPLSSVREDDIPLLRDNNYIIDINDNPIRQSDIPITTSNKYDKERENYIRKIKLETNFFNIFRNTIRILLNDYINAELREKIEDEMYNKLTIYSSKLTNIIKYLKQLVEENGETIKFMDGEDYFKLSDHVSTCVTHSNNEDKCNNKKPFCSFVRKDDENGVCQVILPKKNLLIPTSDNEIYYYARMADELIRYNRIKSFIMKPQMYLSFSVIGYNLKNDEIIMLETLLTKEYFDSLKEATFNKYIKYNSYDEAQPLKTILYDNNVVIDENMKVGDTDTNCGAPIMTAIKSGRIKNCFPRGSKEVEFDKSPYCSFYFIIEIIKSVKGKQYSVNDIRNQLSEEYNKYLPTYESNIVDILIEEGKKTMGNDIKTNKIGSFIDMINLDDYFLTTLDYWLLLVRHQIPSVFLSKANNSYLIETNFEKNDFVAYGNIDDNLVYIVVPGLRSEVLPSYRFLQKPDKSIVMRVDDLNADCEVKNLIIDAFNVDNRKTIPEFLNSYMKIKKTKYIKKKPEERKKIIIESDKEDIKSSEVIIVKKPKKTRKPPKILDTKKTRKVKRTIILDDV